MLNKSNIVATIMLNIVITIRFIKPSENVHIVIL